MKVLIKEEQQNRLKLAPFIYKAISTKRTSLGDNPAFPPYGDFGFEYDVVKKKYEEVNETIDYMIKNGSLESKDPDYLLSVLSMKFEECKKLEEPIRPQLQKLCENIVNGAFSIPSETVIIKCRLVGKIKPKKGMRILPEGDDEKNAYDFEDVDEAILTNKVILKRRFINSLIQGISYWLSTDLDDWHDSVAELNDKIWGLWHDIKNITDYLLFVKEEKISEKNPMQMSYVEVTLGKKGRKTIIDAQGLIFPYLLRETFRGFLELFSSHGLPEDNQKAMYIIRKADFLVAEPWDLRLGMGIMDMLHDNLTNKYQTSLLFKPNRIPYFFTELCELQTDEFNDVMQNFLLGTKKGNVIAREMDSRIAHDDEYQKFKDRIQKKNVQKSLISDGDFSKEELNDYVIQENETDEIMAYHGSGADFDKFNHKKYLNTGAGSQSFGWGTYVTNDEAVAKGYTNSVGGKINIGEDKIRDVMFKVFHYEDNQETERLIYDIMKDLRSLSFNIEDYISVMERYSNSPRVPQNVREHDAKILEILTYIRDNGTVNKLLYEVDIPEDNGTNYIEWYEPFPSEFMKHVLYGFLRIHQNYIDSIAQNDYSFRCSLYKDIQWMRANPNGVEKMINILSDPSDEYDEFFASGFYTNKPDMEGRYVYNRLRKLFNSDKAASLFLLQCGFDGIKYPAGTKWQKPDGASEDAYNYVIFDANKVKIVNKTRM